MSYSYWPIKKFLTTLGSCFFLLSLANWPLLNTPHEEVFPFSNFQMFGSVISRKIDVAIVLLDADGKEFEEPDSFQKNASNDAYYMLQRIGWSHQNFESNRNVFESVHLQAYFNKNLRYRLIRRSFDTIEFYRSGTFQSDVIGEYKATKND